MVNQIYDIKQLTLLLSEMLKEDWIDSESNRQTGVEETISKRLDLKTDKVTTDRYGLVEIKIIRVEGVSKLSLFAKTPKLSEEITKKELLEKHGYFSEQTGSFQLMTTVSTKRVNSRGWQLSVTGNGLVNFIHHGIKVADESITSLTNKMRESMNNLILIRVQSRMEDGVEQFNVVEVLIFSDLDVRKFETALREGIIVIDWRMQMNEGKEVRDHGTAYRIHPKELGSLFKKRETIEGSDIVNLDN